MWIPVCLNADCNPLSIPYILTHRGICFSSRAACIASLHQCCWNVWPPHGIVSCASQTQCGGSSDSKSIERYNLYHPVLPTVNVTNHSNTRERERENERDKEKWCMCVCAGEKAAIPIPPFPPRIYLSLEIGIAGMRVIPRAQWRTI